MELALLIIGALRLATEALTVLRVVRERRRTLPMTSTKHPIRAEIKFFGGKGHREQFETWDQFAAWLSSPSFTVVADRVRTLTVTAPHAKYAADPFRGQPDARGVDPRLARGASGDFAA